MAKVIVIHNYNGGVGKTTMALALARHFSKEQKILLIDGDPQENVTQDLLKQRNHFHHHTAAEIKELISNQLGSIDDILSFYDQHLKVAQEGRSLADVLVKPQMINDAITPITEHLDLLPASGELLDVESLISRNGTMRQDILMQRAFAFLQKSYDYIIIDTSVMQNILLINFLKIADMVLVPIKCDSYSETGAIKVIKLLKAMKDDWDLDFELRLVITMVNRNKNDADTLEKMKLIFGPYLFQSVIRYCAKPHSNSNWYARDIANEKSKVAEDYLSLLKEIRKLMEV